VYAQGALCDLKYNFCAKNLRLVKKKLQPSRNFCSHTKTKNHKNVEFCIIFVISCHFKHNITYFLTFQFWCWLARVACGVARSVVSRLRWLLVHRLLVHGLLQGLLLHQLLHLHRLLVHRLLVHRVLHRLLLSLLHRLLLSLPCSVASPFNSTANPFNSTPLLRIKQIHK